MSDHVAWLLELSVKPGELEGFRTLVQEMVESTEDEPGTLVYEWSVNEAGDHLHLYEHFADSAATMAHLGNFGEKFASRFVAAVDPARLWVYGSPSDEVKEAVSGWGPAYMGRFGGFARPAQATSAAQSP